MSDLYIRLKASFYTHRKTLTLRSKIGDDALWIPTRLWCYAAEHQADGNFSGYTSEMLAMLLECSKHSSSILQALTESGFLDTDGGIHGWEQHNGYHQKWAERAKKAATARWSSEKSDSKEKVDQKKTKKKEEIEIERASLKHSSSMLEAFRLRVGKLFERKPETKWMPNEISALKFAHSLNTPEEDLVDLESYYKSGFEYLKRKPLTLLRGWQAEIECAKAWKLNPTTPSSQPGKPPRKLSTSEKMLMKAGVAL